MLHDYNDKHKISSANFTFCTSVCAVGLWAVIMASEPDKSAGSSTIGGPRT